MQERGQPVADVPDGPVWLSIPRSVLQSGEGLPAGTRMFAHGMENAESVTLSLAPEGERFAARLNVRCRADADAAVIAQQLTRTSSLLLEMIAREGQKPNPADLSGVLTSGSFRSEGRYVRGYWPVERVFVSSLLSGGTT